MRPAHAARIKTMVVAVAALCLVLAMGRLFFGVYEDDEFGTHYLFVKHRPSWRWYFHSPQGMSDLTLEEMSSEEREEQLAYDEFVSAQGWFDRGLFGWQGSVKSPKSHSDEAQHGNGSAREAGRKPRADWNQPEHESADP